VDDFNLFEPTAKRRTKWAGYKSSHIQNTQQNQEEAGI
jgi:hypothetical protein